MSAASDSRPVPGRKRALRFVLLVALVLAGLAALAVGTVRRYPFAIGEWVQRKALASAGFEPLTMADDGPHLVAFTAGEGPPLLFLHGVGEQAGAWSKVASAFTTRYRVWIPDLPGHGESAPESGDLTMAEVVAGAERVLAAAGEEQPATVVGLSMGAWVGTLLAERHPELVSRLLLVAGGALPGEQVDISLQPKTREEAARLIEKIRDPSSPEVPDYVLDDLVRRGRNGPIARLTRDASGLGAHLRDEAALATIHTPTDLIYGTADQMFPPAYGQRLDTLMPASRLTVVERCGHAMTSECPDQLAGVLAEILAMPAPGPELQAKGEPSMEEEPPIEEDL